MFAASLVQLPTNRERFTCVGFQALSGSVGNHWIGNHETFIEKRLQNRYGSASDGRVNRRIGGVKRASFGVGLRKQICPLSAVNSV